MSKERLYCHFQWRRFYGARTSNRNARLGNKKRLLKYLPYIEIYFTPTNNLKVSELRKPIFLFKILSLPPVLLPPYWKLYRDAAFSSVIYNRPTIPERSKKAEGTATEPDNPIP